MRGAYLRLSPEERGTLASVASRLMELKRAMHSLVERVDAASRCAACRGACCVSGRYHFRKADLLVYLVTEEPLFAPLFANGLCPYLAGDRCLMSPPYRPFNCITFNCELIEDLLPEGDRAAFYRMEGEVRGLYGEIERLRPDRSLCGALLDLAAADASPVAAAAAGIPAPLSMQCTE